MYVEHFAQFSETHSVVIEVSDSGIITGVELPNPSLTTDNCPPQYQAYDCGFYADNRKAKALVGTRYLPTEYDEDASAYVVKNTTFWRG